VNIIRAGKTNCRTGDQEVFGPDAESTGIGFRLPGDIDTKSSVIATAVFKILFNGKAGLLDLKPE